MGASAPHHYKKADCDRTSGFTLMRRKDFSELRQSDIFKNTTDFFYSLLLLSMYKPTNGHYHCFNFHKLLQIGRQTTFQVFLLLFAFLFNLLKVK